MPKPVTPETIASIEALGDEKKGRVEAFIAQMAAEPDPPTPLTSAEVAAAYDGLPDAAKARISRVIANNA